MSATRYLEIAERLSAELAECARGTRVASEAEIARRFGVGRAAARAAVQELERRFVVRRTQGSGTFVNRRIDYVISRSVPPSWSATIAAAGATPRALVKSVRTIPLPAALTDRFERPAGSPVHEACPVWWTCTATVWRRSCCRGRGPNCPWSSRCCPSRASCARPV
ncbi:GntR family transcriptional regulator [Streptomyces violaceusniger]|uniref:GntR family transcriptional regulator n=1 Tax=Streptomyces violaceusniger TaxID=68280 RepID=UPI00193AF86B|nr:GntR family transcriptional regulator [Streptomyces hygroscopicus]